MVGKEGLEPSRPKTTDFKSVASADSAISPFEKDFLSHFLYIYYIRIFSKNQFFFFKLFLYLFFLVHVIGFEPT